jgi:hypothetical protein
MTAGQIAAPSCLGFQDDELWGIEPRPQEDGRSALMRKRRPDTEADTDAADDGIRPFPDWSNVRLPSAPRTPSAVSASPSGNGKAGAHRVRPEMSRPT